MTNIRNIIKPENHYEGEILIDITSFAVAQNFFDKPEKAKLFHLVDIESIIEALLFHDRILVLEPTGFGDDVDIQIPRILAELVEEDIIERYSPEFHTTRPEELSVLLEEIPELRNSQRIEIIYLNAFQSYKELAKIYDYQFKVHEQTKFIRQLKQEGITNESLAPLYGQLTQIKIYIKCLHSLDNKGRRVPYLPHSARVSLVKEIDNLYESKRLPIARKIIKEMELSVEQEREALNQTYGSQLELKLPILTTLILSMCKKSSDILDETLNMRRSLKLKRFRNWCNKLQNAIYNDNIKTIKKYDQQLRTVFSELFEKPPQNVLLKSAPQIAFSLKEGNTASTLSNLSSNGYEYLIKYLRRRNLMFLVDLKNRLDGIKHSLDEFERVSKAKLKI